MKKKRQQTENWDDRDYDPSESNRGRKRKAKKLVGKKKEPRKECAKKQKEAHKS